MESKIKSEFTSECLLAEYEAGLDEAAFDIYERYVARVIALARSRVPTGLSQYIEPEEVSQETFQVFFQLADRGEITWKRAGDLWRLLAGIAVNKVRKQKEFLGAAKRDVGKQISLTTEVEGQFDQLVAIELMDTLERILADEKPLARKVLKLKLKGFESSEIGKKIGRTPRTVRRIVEVLKSKIQDSLPELCGPLNRKPKIDFRQYGVDEFDLLRMIGEGGFAKVYLGRERATGHQFAIKVLKKKWIGNPAVEKMFATELESLGELDHPNIVRVFGSGKLPHGNHFLVLELVVGNPVGRGKGNPEQISVWIGQLKNAIGKIHSSDWTHGDIRLSNVLIDERQQLKLLDFGFSAQTNRPELQVKDWEGFEKVCLELHGSVN